MKTTPLITASLLCASLFANAQTGEIHDRKLRIGAFVAPNVSWMKPSATKFEAQVQKNGGAKIGFTYGLMGDWQFADNYSICTGIQLNSTGGQITTQNPVAQDGWALSSDMNYSLQYLEIPVALKLHTDPIGRFSFFGQAGLSIGLNLGKKATYEIVQKRVGATDSVWTTDEKERLTGGLGIIAPIMFQMNLGVGTQYALNDKLDAYVGLFFNNGFAPNATDPTKFNKLPHFTDGNTRLNNFALRLGFYF